MIAENPMRGTRAQTNHQFNHVAHQQRLGQTKGGVPSAGQATLSHNNDTGAEALTGSAPQAGADDETSNNAGADNFAVSKNDQAEDVNSDLTREPAGTSEPKKSDIKLDDEDDNHDEEEDIMPAV